MCFSVFLNDMGIKIISSSGLLWQQETITAKLLAKCLTDRLEELTLESYYSVGTISIFTFSDS